MTIAEFQRRHRPNAETSHSPVRNPAPAVRHVDLGAIDAVESTRAGAASEATDSDGEDEFLAHLERELQKAYRGNDDTAAELAVRIRFWLRADGSVDRAQLVTSSGDRAFDQTALETFGRLRLAALRSQFTSRPFEITFRTRAN